MWSGDTEFSWHKSTFVLAFRSFRKFRTKTLNFGLWATQILYCNRCNHCDDSLNGWQLYGCESVPTLLYLSFVSYVYKKNWQRLFHGKWQNKIEVTDIFCNIVVRETDIIRRKWIEIEQNRAYFYICRLLHWFHTEKCTNLNGIFSMRILWG